MSDFINTVETVGDSALTDSIVSRSITEIADNIVTSIGYRAFSDCSSLISAKFVSATSIGNYAFDSCSKLEKADFGSVASIGTSVFASCAALIALILRKNALCTIASDLYGTAIENGNGYIYVPAALVDSYKEASKWSTYATQFRALEDYTVDGTLTGELDETKI